MKNTRPIKVRKGLAKEANSILKSTLQESRNSAIDFASGQRERGELKKEDYLRANS